MISHRRLQLQGLQGPKKRPEVSLHLWNERRDIQATSLEAPEVREGAEVLDMEVKTPCVEPTVGMDDQDVTGVLEETTFA